MSFSPNQPGPRRRSKRNALAWLLVSIALGVGCDGPSAPTARRNLLLITMDTTRADRLGCYGDETAETPHLDRFAEKGVRFDNAYTAAPLTLPAHATILTGTYPTFHRIHYNGTNALHPDAVTLAERFRDAGIATGAVIGGYVLHHQFGLDQGFDAYYDAFSTDDRPGAEVTRDALDFLDHHADDRFFLWVHYFDPHAPYEPPAEFAERFPVRRYEGEIASMDAQIGRLLEELERRGLEDDTTVCVVADHGEALGQHEPEHRIFLYEQTMRVPLLLRSPGVTPAGEVVGDLVATVDLFPTLLELMGLPFEGTEHGRSLMSLVRGDEEPPRDAYLETHGPRQIYGWSELVGLRSGRWKLIRAPRSELYDIPADPGEVNNLIDLETRVVEDLSDRLEELIGETSVGGEEAATTLSDEARERLESLGYLSGGASSGSGEALVNPADRVEAIFRHHELYALRKQDAAAALPGYRELAEQYPDDLLARAAVGSILVETGQVDEAVPIYESLVELRPEGVVGLRTLAFLYLQQGRQDDALSLAEAAVALNDRSSQSLLIKALVLARLQRYDDSFEAVDRALEFDAGFDAALLHRGELLMQIGSFEQAATTLASIDRDSANRFEGLRRLDQTLARLGRDEQRSQVQAEIQELKAAGRDLKREIDFMGGGY